MKWRPVSPVDRQLAMLWAAVALATVALAAVVLVPLADFFLRGLPACPFRQATGLPCPSCGATRALEALAGGHPVTALSRNPLVTVGALAFVLGGWIAPIWNLRVGRVPDLRGVLPVRIALLAALAGNWIYLWVRGV